MPVASLALNTPRKGAGVVAVPDRTSDLIFFYAISGLDASNAALDSYEYLVLDYNEATNPLQWERTGWQQVTGALLPVGGGGCSGSSSRWQAGLHLFNADNSSPDGVTFEITDNEQYVYLGPGLTTTAAGSAVGTFQSWRINAATGALVTASYDQQCKAANAGYGNIGANAQIFHFGGIGPLNSVKAVAWEYDPTPEPLISVGTNSYSDNGSQLLMARYLHATILDRAFIYMIAGQTGIGVTNTIEYGIW